MLFMIDRLVNENKAVMVGKELKKFFAKQNLTQQDVANKLGVSQVSVSKLLNGKPFGKKLAKKWGDMFGLNPFWLLTGEGMMLQPKDLLQYKQQLMEASEITAKHLIDFFSLEYAPDIPLMTINGKPDPLAGLDMINTIFKKQSTIIKEKDAEINRLNREIGALQEQLRTAKQ